MIESWSSRSAWWRWILPGEVVDALEGLGAGPADDAVDLVPLFQEQFGQVAAVLTGDPGDERALHASGLPFP